MSSITTDQLIDLTEGICILIGIAAAWAIYHGSAAAELPGDATVPDPAVADDMEIDTRGRTL